MAVTRPHSGNDLVPINAGMPRYCFVSSTNCELGFEGLGNIDSHDLTGPPRELFLQSNPAFDFLHADPRYRSVIRKMGLPPMN